MDGGEVIRQPTFSHVPHSKEAAFRWAIGIALRRDKLNRSSNVVVALTGEIHDGYARAAVAPRNLIFRARKMASASINILRAWI